MLHLHAAVLSGWIRHRACNSIRSRAAPFMTTTVRCSLQRVDAWVNQSGALDSERSPIPDPSLPLHPASPLPPHGAGKDSF
eukprot:6200971-Pleurochrysis_carterae.AAC.5